MPVKSFFQRYSVVLYFVLTFLISWGGVILLAGPTYLQGKALTLEDVLILGPVMVNTPTIIGLLMAYLVGGKAGLREVFARIAKWRVGGRWYLPLLIFPVLILLVSFVLSALVAPELRPTFFALGLVFGLLAGFFEEIGWMGFAYPRMQARSGVLKASLLLGLIHAFWHTAADFLGNAITFGEYWLPYFAGFFLFVFALRVLIVWVYANTESLLLAQLMHASSTGFLAVLVPLNIPSAWAVFYPVYAIALWGVVAVVVALYGPSLMRKKRLTINTTD